MLRTTYLADSDPLPHARVDEDGSVLINNLYAAKHVRLQQPMAGIPSLQGSTISFEWSSTPLLNLPFDPPAGGVGCRIYADESSSAEAVSAFVAHIAKLELEPPVQADGWQSWVTTATPEFLMDELVGADAVRVSLGSESPDLVVEAWFTPQVWKTVEPVLPAVKTDLGLFKLSEATPGVYKLEGRARVLGDSKSSPILMYWNAKHVNSGGQYSAKFVEPYGLHPVLDMEVVAEHPTHEVCSLYTLLELPSDVFYDQYQQQDAPQIGDLLAVWGNTDLERAQWDHTQGSLVLLRLSEGSGNYSIPLHFRYAPPTTAQQQHGELPAPRIFWTCRNDVAPPRALEFMNPWENLGIESVFPLADSTFYLLNSTASTLPYAIPAIDPRNEHSVGVGTSLIVVSQAILLLLVMLFRRKSKSEQPKSEQPKSEQPKSEQPKSEKPKSEKPKSE